MPIALRQQSGNTVGAGRSKTCSVALSQSTQPNSLIVVVGTATHHRENFSALSNDPSGYTRLFTRKEDKLTVAVWQRTAAPSTSSISFQGGGETFTIQARVLEFTGVAQVNAFDKLVVRGDNPEGRPGSQFPSTGSTGTLSQADELLFGVVVNRYASTVQFGFSGGLARLSESLSSSSEPDYDRTRLTVHAAITNTTSGYALGGILSSNRDWVAGLISFRGGSLGPARMTSKSQPPMISLKGRARLTAFGPLKAKLQPAVITFGGKAWIGPFEKQFRLGGRSGLLIGAGTEYRVESVEGLGGWDIRSSDSPFPRGDGDQRGVDLQSARQVLFRVNFDGPPAELEAAMQKLLAALRPRRDTDWDLYYRLPALPLQVLRCRPMTLTRELSLEQMLLANQAFALRAADPRIYSARFREVRVPVSSSTATVVTAVSATNIGNAPAYPVIEVTGHPTVQVTGFQLVNITGNIAFEFSGVLPPGASFVADMPATVTSEPRAKITVGGQSKYGSWVAPREPFYIAPDPDAPNGVNALYLRTTPSNTAVTCTLRYRDTWSG